MRRVNIAGGNLSLMDYCSNPAFASGGFIADTQTAGGTIINGSQQQFLLRNSNIDGWTNGVWNQVFSGVIGAPCAVLPQDDVHDAGPQPGNQGKALPICGLGW
jgi:hypothetical protein